MEEQAEQQQRWWQKAKKPLGMFGIIVVCILIIALLAMIIMVYVFNVNVPGLRGKTLWDWLQLLIIPILLAIGGYWFNQIQKNRDERATKQRDKTEREIAKDSQQEAALQAYLDKMSELLLHANLRGSAEEDEVRKIARARTLTVLRGLDSSRKASVIQFLYESDLIDKDKCIISLSEADLSGADFSRVVLIEANLIEAVLFGADLSGADLSGADLSGADLRDANLGNVDTKGAILQLIMAHTTDNSETNVDCDNLSFANLVGADLTGATVSDEQLAKAKSLKGATMPDGSIHP